MLFMTNTTLTALPIRSIRGTSGPFDRPDWLPHLDPRGTGLAAKFIEVVTSMLDHRIQYRTGDSVPITGFFLYDDDGFDRVTVGLELLPYPSYPYWREVHNLFHEEHDFTDLQLVYAVAHELELPPDEVLERLDTARLLRDQRIELQCGRHSRAFAEALAPFFQGCAGLREGAALIVENLRLVQEDDFQVFAELRLRDARGVPYTFLHTMSVFSPEYDRNLDMDLPELAARYLFLDEGLLRRTLLRFFPELVSPVRLLPTPTD